MNTSGKVQTNENEKEEKNKRYIYAIIQVMIALLYLIFLLYGQVVVSQEREVLNRFISIMVTCQVVSHIVIWLIRNSLEEIGYLFV